MYPQFIADFKARVPNLPRTAHLNVGLAIKQIRRRMGLTQEELARDAKINPAALKTLENGYAKFTSISNLQSLAQVLHVGIKDIILEAREWDPANFFALKLNDPGPAQKRRAKYREEIWYKRKTLSYPGFRVDLSAPPLESPAHFHFGLMEIDPGAKIHGLRLDHPDQVAGFLERGALKIIYDAKKEADIFGNQGFVLRGDKIHDFINSDRDNPLRLWLAFSLRPGGTRTKENPKSKPAATGLSVGQAIRQIRQGYAAASRGSKPMTFAALSDLTGLDEKALQYLETTTKPDQVVYWDKIEQICRALKIPMAQFLDLAEGKDDGYLYIATAHDRALIDYRHYLGVRIKSTLLPSADNRFHISEMYIEPRGGIRRLAWKRSDNAMIAAYVEDGELRIEVGRNRKVNLTAGESLYFDASLGYIFTNPAAQQCKLLLASHPAIIF